MGRAQADYNIHHYVQNSTASFDQQGFNEIDGLVMTQISNMNLGNVGIDLYSGGKKTFAELMGDAEKNGSAMAEAFKNMSPDNQALLNELANSPRFRNMTVSNFVKDPAKNGIQGFPSVGDEQHMEQFAAATITYQQNGKTYNYVSYRATDNTADGWAEDLAMLYSMNTQAQSDSTAYMNIVAGLKDGYITGGGHSKGGGDFEYAYLFCDPKVRERIVKGYVYDSPGLNQEVLAATQYYEDYLRITEGSFICPQDSIVGQLLQEGGNATFVHSVESGFNQHDPYSWEINHEAYSFVGDRQTALSVYIDEALDEAVANLSQEQKVAVFDYVSYLLYHSGGEGLSGLGDLFMKDWKNEDGSFNWGKLGSIWDVLYADWEQMTAEEKKNLTTAVGTVLSIFAGVGAEHLKEDAKGWCQDWLQEIGKGLLDAWNGVSKLLGGKLDGFRDFLASTYQAIADGFGRLANWLESHSYGGKYAASHPQILLDTQKLRMYGQRLEAVNRRLSDLDGRLDSLYWRAGLLDLWNLMQADLLTGSSWRVRRCASYLAETAGDFEAAETELSNI